MGAHLEMAQKSCVLIFDLGGTFVLCRSSSNFVLLDSAAKFMELGDGQLAA